MNALAEVRREGRQAVVEAMLARLAGSSAWPDTLAAGPDRKRLSVRARPPYDEALRGASRALWILEHEITARVRPCTESTTRSRALTGAEVAGLLAGCVGGPLHLGWFVLVGDERSLGPLLRSALEVAADIAARRGWKSPRAGFLRDLSALALAEVLTSHITSARARARWMQLSHTGWGKVWAPRYEQRLWPVVAAWPSTVLEHVERRL